jgi:hypothetical protein
MKSRRNLWQKATAPPICGRFRSIGVEKIGELESKLKATLPIAYVEFLFHSRSSHGSRRL